MSVRRLDPVQPESFAFTPENLRWAEGIMGNYPPGKQASAVLLLLWRAQEQEGWLTRPAIEYVAKLLEMADKHAGGRVVSTLEGGYNLQALARSTAAHVQVLMQVS